MCRGGTSGVRAPVPTGGIGHGRGFVTARLAAAGRRAAQRCADSIPPELELLLVQDGLPQEIDGIDIVPVVQIGGTQKLPGVGIEFRNGVRALVGTRRADRLDESNLEV